MANPRHTWAFFSVPGNIHRCPRQGDVVAAAVRRHLPGRVRERCLSGCPDCFLSRPPAACPVGREVVYGPVAQLHIAPPGIGRGVSTCQGPLSAVPPPRVGGRNAACTSAPSRNSPSSCRKLSEELWDSSYRPIPSAFRSTGRSASCRLAQCGFSKPLFRERNVRCLR